MFQAVDVVHHRCRQVRDITLSEPPQRQTAQPFRKGEACVAHFVIHKSVGGPILLEVRDERQHDERKEQTYKKPGVGERRAVGKRVHIVLHH